MIPKEPIVYYDGICKFCHGSVNFLVAIDSHRVLKFASLQSESGKQLQQKMVELPDSIVLYIDGIVKVKSDAILSIMELLGFPYNLLGIFKIIPLYFRDLMYDFIAKNRYQFFGKFDTCRVPNAFDKDRFIE